MFIVSFQRLQLSRFTHVPLSIFFLFFLFSKIQAQPLIEWSEGLGGSLNDIPEVVHATSGGNFIVAGRSASSDGLIDNNKGGVDLWVTELDGDGNLIWEKNYGGSEDDYAMDLQATGDGGYIMLGGSSSADGDLNNNNGRVDLWVLKINAVGELQWSKNFGGSGVEMGTSIQTIVDGYILAGCTGSGGEVGVSAGFGGNEFWVLKLDLDGNLIWEKTYGGKRHDAAKSIVANGNGQYLIAGNTWSDDGDISSSYGHSDAWVIKIDNVGILLWEKNFGGATPDRLNSLAKTNDGNYIFAGVKSEMDLVSNGYYGRYDEQYWILKFSESGQVLWEKTYGGNKYDEAFSVEPTLDGGYIIGGSIQSNLDSFSSNAGNLDAWIIKTDEIGTTEWSELYGGAGNENLKSIAETTDGGFIMLGTTNSYFIDTFLVNHGFFDWWVVKFGGNSVNVNLGNDLTVCHEETFTLDASVTGCNCTYLWNDGSTDAIRNLFITSMTNYSVTVTNADGVEGVDQINVFTSQPSVNISTINTQCFGYEDGAITLTPAEQNYSYLWNTGSTDKDLTNLGAGAYAFTVTDENGCTIINEVIISEPLPITISENIIEVNCHGNSTGSIDLNVEGGAGNFQYAWESGETTPDIYNLDAGGYTVTITDLNGCVKVQNWIVNQPPAIDIESNPFPTSCFDSEDGGAYMNINGGVGNFSYLWSNGSTGASLDGVSTGTYTLTVTDGNFCQKIETVQVFSPDAIIIEETVQNADCFGNDSGSITTQISGGVGSYDYIWSNGAMTPNISQISSGTYTLTITDDNFCEKVKEIIVNQNSDIEIFSQIETPSCHDTADGAIDIFLSGGAGNFSYIWNTGADTEDIDGIESGDYIVTVTDGSGCEEIQLFTIDAPDSISIMSTIYEISCFGENNGMIQTEAIGGTGSYQYTWNNNEITSAIFSLTEGEYALTITDDNGCVLSETFNLSQPDPIEITPIFTEVSCYGMSDGAIDLEVTGGNGGYVFNWNTGANSDLSSGNYSVTVTDMNNCEAIQDFFLPQPDSLIISIVAFDPVNGNDGVITATPIGGTPPYDFNWNDGMWMEAEISDLSAGSYDLIVTDASGCSENVSVLLNTTSIFEIENLQTFEIFPNPNDGTFFLKLGFEKKENIEISILNDLGQVIQDYYRNSKFILEKTNLEYLASGLFFVKIKTENGVVVKKVVVQH